MYCLRCNNTGYIRSQDAQDESEVCPLCKGKSPKFQERLIRSDIVDGVTVQYYARMNTFGAWTYQMIYKTKNRLLKTVYLSEGSASEE